MGNSDILAIVIGKVIRSLFLAVIFAFIFYYFWPDNAGYITVGLYIFILGDSWLGLPALKDIKNQDCFFGNLNPFVLVALVSSLIVILYMAIITIFFPMIFGTSFTLPTDFYGFSPKMVIAIFVIFMLLIHSYIDYRDYNRL